MSNLPDEEDQPKERLPAEGKDGLNRLPARKLCNKYNNPNPIKGDGALGNEKTGKMYYQGGDKKKLVEVVQRMLKELGHDLGTAGPEGDGIDGNFGDSTENAVKQFQEKHKDWDSNALKVDGLVGPDTADALNREMVGKWYDHYQTHEKLVKGVPHHAVTSEFISKGLSVETGRAKTAKVFLVGPIPESTENKLRVRLHNHIGEPMTEVQYKLVVGGKTTEDLSKDGWVLIEYPADVCPECSIEWGSRSEDGLYPYKLDVAIDCSTGDERTQAINKLNNLGYPMEDSSNDSSDERYEKNVHAFQVDYHVKESGLLPDGRLPPQTKKKLWSIFESEDCNASTNSGIE